MKLYRVANRATGQDLGVVDAVDERGALDAISRAAGYRDFAEASAVESVVSNEMIVVAAEERVGNASVSELLGVSEAAVRQRRPARG